MSLAYYSNLSELKAVSTDSLVTGNFVVVTDFDGGKMPGFYVFYTGVPGDFSLTQMGGPVGYGEPHIVIADDNNGYWVKTPSIYIANS